jgi:hypothetical protein
MHYALKNEWILMTIPKASEPIRYRNTVAEASTYKEGRFDTPIIASKFLKTFSLQNQSLLEKLNVTYFQAYSELLFTLKI